MQASSLYYSFSYHAYVFCIGRHSINYEESIREKTLQLQFSQIKTVYDYFNIAWLLNSRSWHRHAALMYSLSSCVCDSKKSKAMLYIYCYIPITIHITRMWRSMHRPHTCTHTKKQACIDGVYTVTPTQTSMQALLHE